MCISKLPPKYDFFPAHFVSFQTHFANNRTYLASNDNEMVVRLYKCYFGFDESDKLVNYFQLGMRLLLIHALHI